MKKRQSQLLPRPAICISIMALALLPGHGLAQEKTGACWYDSQGRTAGADSCRIGSRLTPCADSSADCTINTVGTCGGSGSYAAFAVLTPDDNYQCPETFADAQQLILSRRGGNGQGSQAEAGDDDVRESGMAQVAGTYQRSPVENDWHVGTITRNGNSFTWTNQAGVSWSLTPDYQNDALVTGPENPYYDQGSREFDLIVEDDVLVGFNFNGEAYMKQSAGSYGGGQASARDERDESSMREAAPATNSRDRFVDGGDGTVMDTQTGLTWLKDASCADMPGLDAEGRASTRSDAIAAASSLRNGDCGLSDGSSAGTWRLPTAAEFCGGWGPTTQGNCSDGAASGLLDTRFTGPSLSNSAGTGQWNEGDPFYGVPTDNFSHYYSSTSSLAGDETSWLFYLGQGTMFMSTDLIPGGYVWPVRN